MSGSSGASTTEGDGRYPRENLKAENDLQAGDASWSLAPDLTFDALDSDQPQLTGRRDQCYVVARVRHAVLWNLPRRPTPQAQRLALDQPQEKGRNRFITVTEEMPS